MKVKRSYGMLYQALTPTKVWLVKENHMAKGLIKHQARQNALNFLGKDLTRRAKSKCEVCEQAGVALFIYEIPPVQNEPDYDHCLMLCETCFTQLTTAKQLDMHHWRCLSKSIWSQQAAVQVVSLRLLRQIAATQDWAADTLEQVYIDADVEQWAETPV